MSDSTVVPLVGRRDDRKERTSQSLNWDAVADGMPDFYAAPSTQYYRACEIELLNREVGSLAGKKILKLDLWNEAINTRILAWMKSQGADVYGMDLSHVVTTRAKNTSRSEGADLSLARADIREVPFRSSSFDLVYTMGTIEHIPEYAQALAEINRVLKPGGRAIIGVPYKWDIFLRPLLVMALESIGKYPYAPEKSFSARALKREVEASGLVVRKRTGILIIPGILRMADLFLHTRKVPLARMTTPLMKFFEFVETRFAWVPGRIGYLITMVADKPR